MNVNRAVLYLGCFTIGIIAGLRSLTAPAVVSWAARLGWLDLSGSWLSFLGSRTASIILSLLALAELVADKLPKTPNRTNLGPLVFRVITGGFSSIAICISAHQSLVIGTLLGVFGSIAAGLLVMRFAIAWWKRLGFRTLAWRWRKILSPSAAVF